MPRISPRANNKKFCTVECRKAYTLEHPSTAPSQTKEARDAYNRNRWNGKAEGKTKCEDCGGWYYGIAYHTTQRHGITAEDYKAMHGLNRGLGLLPQAVKERKARATRSNGTMENLKAGAHTRYKPGDTRAGRYERRPQTLAMLREHNIKQAQRAQEKQKQQLKGTAN